MPDLTREECIELSEEIDYMWDEEWAPLDAEAERLLKECEELQKKVDDLNTKREEMAAERERELEEMAQLETLNGQILDRLVDLETEIPEAEAAVQTAEEELATKEADFAAAEAALHAQLDLVEYWIEQYQIAQDNLDCLVPGTEQYDGWHVKYHEADENIVAFEEPLPELEAAFELADEEVLRARDELDQAEEKLAELIDERAQIEEDHIDNEERIEEIKGRDFMAEIDSLISDIMMAEMERDEKCEAADRKQEEADVKAAEIEMMEAEYEQHCLIYEEEEEEEAAPLE